MDNNNRSQNNQYNQNNPQPYPNTPPPQGTPPSPTEFHDNIPPMPQGQSMSPAIASNESANATMSIDQKSEKSHNIGRALFVICFFALIIGGIIAALYFTKSGIFGEERISTGNHSYIVDKNDWQIDEVDESDYSITLSSNSGDIMLSINDNPQLSDYQYDSPSVAQTLGAIGSAGSGTKKTSGNISCMVYDSTSSYQGVNIKLKYAFCNVANDYNALIGIASQSNSSLEKYLDEGIKILQTGQK